MKTTENLLSILIIDIKPSMKEVFDDEYIRKTDEPKFKLKYYLL